VVLNLDGLYCEMIILLDYFAVSTENGGVVYCLFFGKSQHFVS
jgi:hypothetical protein